ncbi:hypothetical protein AGMMS49525_11790 [Bacteroidia bacterium]|nr:hypothetical protein AGMMS49525_11790 [Bacteroidia bacterium]
MKAKVKNKTVTQKIDVVNPAATKLFTIAPYLYITLFAVLAAVWLYVYNRYQILNFLEDGQLFRTDKYYFWSYLNTPGGLSQYIGAFLTQSYHFFVIGAIVLSLAISSVFLLFWKICVAESTAIAKSEKSHFFFVLLFIIPIFLLAACTNSLHVRLGHIVGILVVLTLFWLYKLSKKNNLRYLWAVLAYLLAYFIAGGHAILLVALMVTDALFCPKQPLNLKELRLRSAVITVVWALLIPDFAYNRVYVTSLKTAYLSQTPFDLLENDKVLFYYIAWCSIPVLYVVWRWIASKNPVATVKKPILWVVLGFFVIFPFMFWQLKKVTDRETEYVMHIAYEVERANWDKVLELGKKEGMRNAVPVAYFTDIALSEKGRLASDMFNYPQTGTYGLFIAMKNHFTTALYMGELHYRLGMIQEAEHDAFEALVVSPTEHGAKALRRLVYTTMLRRDTPGFEKYVGLMEKSPLYSHWAKEQREHYTHYFADSSYVIPKTPRNIATTNSFMVDYNVPFLNMESILQQNPGDKKAFEYLMMFFLAHQDLISFYKKWDEYYPTMHYDTMPRHFEEALLIYAVATNQQAEVLTKYPVSQSTIDRFVAYDKELKTAKTKVALNLLKQKYGNTYFYYHLNAKPMLLEDIYNMSVY